MDREQLRATQAPLKAQYREDPAQAFVPHFTLTEDSEMRRSPCSVATGQAMVEARLRPATGGDGSLACSGDMLLQALVACAGVTLRSVARSAGDSIIEGSVRAEGDLDFRGTLGVERDAPVSFTAISLEFDLTTSATPEEVADLVSTTERYCVVLQTLAGTPRITVGSEAGSA